MLYASTKCGIIWDLKVNVVKGNMIFMLYACIKCGIIWDLKVNVVKQNMLFMLFACTNSMKSISYHNFVESLSYHLFLIIELWGFINSFWGC
jgi:hypothetical protein